MFILRFFWEKLRLKIILMSAKVFFVWTGVFGFIFIGSIIALIFFRPFLAKFLFGFLAFLALFGWSALMVYTRLHSYFWVKGQIKHLNQELDERLGQVSKKAEETEEEQLGI